MRLRSYGGDCLGAITVVALIKSSAASVATVNTLPGCIQRSVPCGSAGQALTSYANGAVGANVQADSSSAGGCSAAIAIRTEPNAGLDFGLIGAPNPIAATTSANTAARPLKANTTADAAHASTAASRSRPCRIRAAYAVEPT